MVVSKKHYIKPLKPTLREKKRYVVFRVMAERKLGIPAVKNAIYQAFASLWGDITLARAGFSLLPETWDPVAQQGVFKVGHTAVDQAKAALCFVTHIEKQAAMVYTRGVSGTLRAAREKYYSQHYSKKEHSTKKIQPTTKEGDR
ncbi:hypothetical protein COY95_01940 [Candidatus Woesearchaeota archaeon CG_4_10_14_0_8_um_filter_47_5]|nr:MAG: hypothetical protein COY95_01940 [Candidatus Woesearchaeota archaeon CG_4_10_14_0_8_um_filter_47_5]